MTKGTAFDQRAQDTLLRLQVYETRVKLLRNIVDNCSGNPELRKEMLLKGLENMLSDKHLHGSPQSEREYWTVLRTELTVIEQQDADVRRRAQELFARLEHLTADARKRYGNELDKYGLRYLHDGSPVPAGSRGAPLL